MDDAVGLDRSNLLAPAMLEGDECHDSPFLDADLVLHEPDASQRGLWRRSDLCRIKPVLQDTVTSLPPSFRAIPHLAKGSFGRWIHLRAESDLSRQFNPILPVQSSREK